LHKISLYHPTEKKINIIRNPQTIIDSGKTTPQKVVKIGREKKMWHLKSFTREG